MLSSEPSLGQNYYQKSMGQVPDFEGSIRGVPETQKNYFDGKSKKLNSNNTSSKKNIMQRDLDEKFQLKKVRYLTPPPPISASPI